MPTPSFNLQNGSVLGTWPSKGGTFYWYNPTSSPVVLTNCGNFCTQDSYTVPASNSPSNGYLQVTLLNMPNANPYAFTDPAWNAPGMPHLQAPTMPDAVENDEDETAADREVA